MISRKATTPSSKNWLDRLSPRLLKLGINLWPPFLGSGIKVISISPDFRHVKAVLKSRLFNKNYVGTHFGGSIFSLSDPFFMLILIKNLGRNYIVWDKAAQIEFKKPARGTLTAIFTFQDDEIELIRQMANQNGKHIFDKSVDILNEQGEIVASVSKTLYVKCKDTARIAESILIEQDK